jgi:Ser/Thr protein kinase RdoA (MazF antagonist)
MLRFVSEPLEIAHAWGDDARLIERLAGGSRNEVWAIQLGGEKYTLRRSIRPPDALAWELDLIEYLASAGFGVPAVHQTLNGERTSGGWFVLSWIAGRRPTAEVEWRTVIEELQRLHDVTRQWVQRPSFASSRQLLAQPSGGDIDLNAMPPDVVDSCRAAWRELGDAPTSVIHGDPRGNVLVTRDGVAFIDWDEARVDASVFDLADLPVAPDVPEHTLQAARRAASAWEAAVFWCTDPEYARRRFATVRG